ncbi:MAG: putative selenoprotein [Moraxellaceae bacterium]|nr:MAG: putative selenoprotein [Moraxellaceae bacterium]
MAVLPFSALSWRQRVQLVFSRLAQCFRLMVGVHDYQAYVQHVQLHHPEQIPMTEKQFHRHCLDARYPSKAGKLGKCPC